MNRVLAFALLLLAAPLLQAHEGTHNSIAEAYQHAAAREPSFETFCATGLQAGHVLTDFTITEETGANRFVMTAKCYRAGDGSTMNLGPENFYWVAGTGCATGEVFDRASLQCVDAQQRCLGKNAIVPDTSTFAGAFGTCVDGCMIGEREPQSTGSVQVDQQSTKINFGKVGFTGETCTGSVELPNFDTGKTCVPAGGGMTVCATPDGRHCYSTKSTVSTLADDAICWQPGETGSKSKGPVTQTRGPGTQTPTPPAPPTGESHTPGPGNPVTTTTTTPGGTTINTSVANVTNTNGTNGPNQQIGDGKGEGEEGEENGLTGGGDCATPPIPTGDVVMGFIAAKIWSVACEGEGLAGEAEGMDDSDGSEGTEGNSLWGTDDATTVVLDELGLGFGETCPDPPQILEGTPLDWSLLCTVMGYVGLLIFAAAHLHAFFIIAGD